MEKIIRFDGEQFLCEQVYILETKKQYVSISYLSKQGKNYVGDIEGLSIPDEKDLDEVAKFEATVNDWLLTKDANYQIGNI